MSRHLTGRRWRPSGPHLMSPSSLASMARRRFLKPSSAIRSRQGGGSSSARLIVRSDFWCAVSRHAALVTQEVFNLPNPPDAILPNAVRLPPKPPFAARDPHRVVFTGTLVETKGVVSLVKAWPEVVAQVPGAQLHMFGKDGRMGHEGSMVKYLRDRMDGPTSRSVFFHGHVSQDVIYQNLATARAAVFPSYTEAFGIAPVEAMASGCDHIYEAICWSGDHRRWGRWTFRDSSDPADIAELSCVCCRMRKLHNAWGRADGRQQKPSIHHISFLSAT